MTANVTKSAPKKTLASTVEDKIRADIINGELVPQTKLRIKNLMERYDASSIPLREALSRLTALGFIELVDHQGFSVRNITTSEIYDITHVRCMIECQALENSIRNADLEWESRLLGVHHTLTNLPLKNPDTGELSNRWETVHKDFHDALLSNCDSFWLKKISATLRDQTSRYRFLSQKYTAEGKRDVPAEHKEILEAVISRDIERAKAVLTAHYEKTADAIAAMMTEK